MSKVWIYGKHSCIEALKNPIRIIYEVRCSSQEAKALVHSIRPDLRVAIYSQDHISNSVRNSNHQGLAMYCEGLPVHKYLSVELLEGHSRILIADGITDPNNLAAIQRSMAATSFTALIVPKKHAPDIEKHCLKSSCGAIEHLTIFQIPNLTEAVKFLKKKLGFTAIALDEGGDKWHEITKAFDFKDANIVGIIGSEGAGIRKTILKECDFRLSLYSNPEFPVFNAGVAAAIFMHMTYMQQQI